MWLYEISLLFSLSWRVSILGVVILNAPRIYHMSYRYVTLNFEGQGEHERLVIFIIRMTALYRPPLIFPSSGTISLAEV